MSNDVPQHDRAMVTAVRSEVGAGSIAAMLADAGIPVGIEPLGPLGGSPMDPAAVSFGVFVPINELDRARTLVTETPSVDWNDIDVGTRDDDLPLSLRHGHMPWPARAAFIVTVIVAVGALIAMVVMAVMAPR